MPEEHKASAVSGDKSDNTDTSAKTVPESDLIALKQSLEAQVKEAIGTAEAVRKQLAEVTASLGTERAARTAAEAKAKELEPKIQELTKLQETHQATTKQLADLKTAQLEQRRQALIVRGVDSAKAKTLDEAAIAVLEAHLPATRATSGFDARGTGSDGGGKKSALEHIRAGLEQSHRS